ncbi:MAG: hypothetical protein JXA23_06360 [Bacteroidales bacterium]|nr:hypothetical protein [Bacteroidales bacterium]
MKKQTIRSSIMLTAISLLLYAGSSCTTMVLRSRGVKNPSFQTEQRIRAFLGKRGVPGYDGSFLVKDSTSFFNLIKRIHSYPSVSYFTPHGELIIINDSGYCAGVAYNYGTTFTSGKPVRIDTSFSLPELNRLIRPLNFPAVIDTGDADIILVACWATYLGKINDNVFATCAAVRNNDYVRSRIYLINIDFLDSWGMTSIGKKIYQ